MQALIDRLPDNLSIKDVNSRFVIANQATANRMGIAQPADLIGKSDLEFFPSEISEKFIADEQEIVRSGKPMIDKEEHFFKTWILTTKVPLRNERNEIVGIAGVSRDITERKLADALREGQAQILEMIAVSAPLTEVLERLVLLMESQFRGIIGAVLLLDEKSALLRYGAAPSLPSGYAKAVDGLPVSAKAGSSGTAAYRREAVAVADVTTDPLWEEYRALAAKYEIRSCWSTPILSHLGAVLGVFSMYSKESRRPTNSEQRLIDVATRIAGIAIERKLAEERIRFMANHDALTGLPNRALLSDRLSQALLRAQSDDRWVTALFIDLDNFKFINDSLGHNAGDELLKTIAKRMVDCVRATDTVVRLGGDEFVVVLIDQPKDMDAISATVQKLRSAIAEPIRWRATISG